MDIIESAINLPQAAQQAKALLTEIRQGTSLLALGQRILSDRRFQLGQILRRVREHFPVSGKGAAGWGRFCKTVGIKRSTAVRYIETAAQVEARPELADRRTFQDIYLELGLALRPPSERFAAAAAANVPPGTTVTTAGAGGAGGPACDAGADGSGGAHDTGAAELVDLDDDDAEETRQGRPPLSERERRSDIYMVRLNTAETLRLRHLSGLLLLRDAEVFREGLLALEEREAQKTASLGSRPASPIRRMR